MLPLIVLGAGALIAVQLGAGVYVGFHFGKGAAALPALESEMERLTPPPGSLKAGHRAQSEFSGASVVDTYRFAGATWPDIHYVMVETFSVNGWTPVFEPHSTGQRMRFVKVGVPAGRTYLNLDGTLQPTDAQDAGFTFSVEVSWRGQ
jgi:hypothetical protein